MARHDQPEWRDSMRLRFDFNNAMADAIGPEHGVTEEAVNTLAGRVRHSHEGLRRRRQAGDLAWMELPYAHEVVRDVLGYVDSVAGRFDNFVVLGIGGSALGSSAVASALNHPYQALLPSAQRQGRPRLFVLDNVDPDQIDGFLNVVDLDRTLFNVITKSGSTAETMAQFLIVRRMLNDRVGRSHVDRIVCTTDPHSGELRAIVRAEGYRAFDVPPGVGGRFSVLSPVGLLAAAMTGVDVTALLAGAAYADQLCSEPDVWRNAAYMNAVLHYLGYGAGRTISVMMPYSHALRGIADWYCQLWAESLGKSTDLEGNVVYLGPTAVKAVGVPDQHSQMQLYTDGAFDKLITFVAVERFKNEVPIPSGFPEAPGVAYLGGHTLNDLMHAAREASVVALSQKQRSNVTFTLPEVNPFTVGQLLYLLEVQTAMAGELFKVNTYDQPGAEAGKVAAFAVIGRPGFEKQKQEIVAGRKFSPKYVI